MKAIAILILLSVSFGTSPAKARDRHIRSITIHSSWGGLGQPAQSHLVIQRKADNYASNNGIVSREQVEALLNAIEEPRIAGPDRANLGITAQWLLDHADEAGKYAANFDYHSGSPEQKGIFRSAFTNVKTIQRRLRTLYESFHTDDYPHISLQLTFDNGTVLSVMSDSQNPFMIPWKVNRAGITSETYNANISRALMVLLPPKFANRERLTTGNQSVDGLIPELAKITAAQVKDRWEMLGAEETAGDALDTLKRTYQVRRAEVNSYHGLDYGKEWTAGGPHEENLQVNLWRCGFPPHFAVSAILLVQDRQVQGVGVLPQRIARYEKLVFSIQWLNRYWAQHPDAYAWLFYVHGRSFTDKAMRIFAADMKEVDREDLVEKVRAVQNQAALLVTGDGDDWIILPDKSMILWRWQSLSSILLWKPKDFSAKGCTEYQGTSGGCSGALISPEGKIVP